LLAGFFVSDWAGRCPLLFVKREFYQMFSGFSGLSKISFDTNSI
jgi:hypothetical protein